MWRCNVWCSNGYGFTFVREDYSLKLSILLLHSFQENNLLTPNQCLHSWVCRLQNCSCLSAVPHPWPLKLWHSPVHHDTAHYRNQYRSQVGMKRVCSCVVSYEIGLADLSGLGVTTSNTINFRGSLPPRVSSLSATNGLRFTTSTVQPLITGLS